MLKRNSTPFTFERTDDAGGRRIERCNGLIGDIRLHLDKLVSLDDAKIRDAVLPALFEQQIKAPSLLLIGADDKRSAAVERNVEISCKISHHGIALDVELCHERTRHAVVACVDDGAVCLGRTAADVLFLFEDTDAGVVAGQLPGNSAAANTGTDNDYIIHMETSNQQKREHAKENRSFQRLPRMLSSLRIAMNFSQPMVYPFSPLCKLKA